MPDQNSREDKERKPDPVSPDNIPQIENKKAESTAEEKQRQSDKFFRRASLLIDFFVLVSVAVYSVFAALQWTAMRDQLRIAQAQIGSSQLEQRAWITVISAKLTKSLTVGERPSVTLVYQNSGKTLAYDVEVGGAVVLKEGLSREEQEQGPAETGTRNFSKGLLAPNALSASAAEREAKLSQNELNALRNDKLFLYVGGVIEYRDTFKVLHRTKFCYWATSKDIDTLQLHNCGYGNTADDNEYP